MHAYSESSKEKLATLDHRLRSVFELVAEFWDITILEGHRTAARQAELFAQGASKLDGVERKSNHQSLPSKAVDAIPHPVDFEDTLRIKAFAGSVIAIGQHLGYKIRWGGDWDRDYDQHDQSFNDLVHFEILD